MKKGLALGVVLGILVGYGSPAGAVSMNFTGNFRTEGFYLSKPGLGNAAIPEAKAYIIARALLQPNLVIDDHFSLKSEWSMLRSGGFTPSGLAPSGMVVGNGGYVFGDTATNAFSTFNLNRVWLEWLSDIGVLRIGRMPFDWAYGLLWDSGSRDPWDDWQTTLDRLEYRLHLGNVIGGIALSKTRKLSVLGDDNDSTFYTVFLQYNNAETDVEGGILYENQWRSPAQAAALLTGNSNPYALPPGSNPTPLSTKTPYPLNNHVLDIYLKKTLGYFTLGGEFAWVTGKAVDYAGTHGGPQNMNAYGATFRASYEYHKLKAFLDFLFASGDADLNNGDMTGFVLLHRNRRPGLILGRELIGPYTGNNANQGSCVVYGGKDSFSGCLFLRPGISFDWSASLSSGLEVIFAQKASPVAGSSGSLGVEVDLGTTYALYQNFDVGTNFAVLFPGDGLGQPSPATPFALRFTAAVRF